jgi:hypothetical protein
MKVRETEGTDYRRKRRRGEKKKNRIDRYESKRDRRDGL